MPVHGVAVRLGREAGIEMVVRLLPGVARVSNCPLNELYHQFLMLAVEGGVSDPTTPTPGCLEYRDRSVEIHLADLGGGPEYVPLLELVVERARVASR